MKKKVLQKKDKFMRQLSFNLLAVSLMLTSVFFTSCEKDEEARKYTVTVTVQYPEGYDTQYAEGFLVKITSTASAKEDSATTRADGTATFNLLSGVYSISAVGENSEYAFNGTSANLTISEDKNIDITLKAVALQGGLVFKEIYYTGSKTTADGSYYSDQFQEIYNNSDEVMYLDGLALGYLTPTNASGISTWVDANENLLTRLPLQFYVFYIPGSGKDYPIQPRTSIVIAQDGIDHKTDPLGNALSPVNLGNADWEYFCGDINGGKDADAAGVPNLSLMYTTTTSMYDMLYTVSGPAIVMFRLPQGTDPATFASNPDNLSTAPGSTSSTKYLMIPKECVIDAVECVQVEENKRNKRLPADLDAGSVYCSGTYVSKSIRRKVKQIIDGKVIYKDTNNSSEDFLGDQPPAPKVHPAVVD